MYQFFSKPDAYIARCGDMSAALTECRIDGAPAFMRGLRLLFASDFHVLRRTTREQLDGLAGRIADAAPDLLLLGGDYSDRAEDAARLFEALSAVRPPLGAFGVLGNNDVEAWEGRLKQLKSLMARSGCRLLVNESAEVKYNGGTLRIGGVDEHKYGAPDASTLFPAAPDSNAYQILLSHYPIRPNAKPDLMLSGHTHGGQFNFLGITPFTIGFERFRRKPLVSMGVSGMSERDGMKLLVSKGIGASRIQLRAGVRPEINLITF